MGSYDKLGYAHMSIEILSYREYRDQRVLGERRDLGSGLLGRGDWEKSEGV